MYSAHTGDVYCMVYCTVHSYWVSNLLYPSMNPSSKYHPAECFIGGSSPCIEKGPGDMELKLPVVFTESATAFILAFVYWIGNYTFILPFVYWVGNCFHFVNILLISELATAFIFSVFYSVGNCFYLVSCSLSWQLLFSFCPLFIKLATVLILSVVHKVGNCFHFASCSLIWQLPPFGNYLLS